MSYHSTDSFATARNFCSTEGVRWKSSSNGEEIGGRSSRCCLGRVYNSARRKFAVLSTRLCVPALRMGNDWSCGGRPEGEAEPPSNVDVVLIDGQPVSREEYEFAMTKKKENEAIFLVRAGASMVISKRSEAQEHFESEIEWSTVSALDNKWALGEDTMTSGFNTDYRRDAVQNLASYFEGDDFFDDASETSGSEEDDGGNLEEGKQGPTVPRASAGSVTIEMTTESRDIEMKALSRQEVEVGVAVMEEGTPVVSFPPASAEEKKVSRVEQERETIREVSAIVPNVICEEIIRVGLNQDGWELVEDVPKLRSTLYRARNSSPGVAAYKIVHIIAGKPEQVLHWFDDINERKSFDDTYKHSNITRVDEITNILHFRYKTWLTCLDFVDFRRIWKKVPFDLRLPEMDGDHFTEKLREKSKKVIVLGFIDADGHKLAPKHDPKYTRCHSARPCGLIFQHWAVPGRPGKPFTKVTYFSASKSASVQPPQFVLDNNAVSSMKSFKKAVDKHSAQKLGWK